MDPMKLCTTDQERSTVISPDACDIGSHPGKGLHNPFHGPFLDRSISCESNVKILCAEDA
jgi:hypothetical protein